MTVESGDSGTGAVFVEIGTEMLLIIIVSDFEVYEFDSQTGVSS